MLLYLSQRQVLSSTFRKLILREKLYRFVPYARRLKLVRPSMYAPNICADAFRRKKDAFQCGHSALALPDKLAQLLSIYRKCYDIRPSWKFLLKLEILHALQNSVVTNRNVFLQWLQRLCQAA